MVGLSNALSLIDIYYAWRKEMDKILILLPIKSNSKRLPRKSLKLLNGKPMMLYALHAAFRSRFREIFISTASEEVVDTLKEVVSIAQLHPIKFIPRPQYLAEDPFEIADVCKHALNYLKEEYKTLIMIQSTNPFVTSEDINDCYDLFIKHDRKTVRSVTPVGKQVWRPAGLYEGGEIRVITPYSSNSFIGNGSIVVIDIKRFLEIKTLADIVTIPYIMPKKRSVDIDTEMDFKIAEMLMS